MLAEFPYAAIIIGTVIVGLWLSNMVYDLKVPHYISGKSAMPPAGWDF